MIAFYESHVLMLRDQKKPTFLWFTFDANKVPVAVHQTEDVSKAHKEMSTVDLYQLAVMACNSISENLRGQFVIVPINIRVDIDEEYLIAIS
jgi:hypothetical protein